MYSERLIVGIRGQVVAIDTATGAEAWRTPLPITSFLASRNDIVSVLKKEGVIFAATSGFVFALAESDGQVLWKNELPGLGFNEVSLALDGSAIKTVREVIYRDDPLAHQPTAFNH
jgi:outer membrane protein assembly factor BamB